MFLAYIPAKFLAWLVQALLKMNVRNGTHCGKIAGAALCVTRTKRSQHL